MVLSLSGTEKIYKMLIQIQDKTYNFDIILT